MSATRRDDGSYDIDPAELRRAFAVVTRMCPSYVSMNFYRGISVNMITVSSASL